MAVIIGVTIRGVVDHYLIELESIVAEPVLIHSRIRKWKDISLPEVCLVRD